MIMKSSTSNEISNGWMVGLYGVSIEKLVYLPANFSTTTTATTTPYSTHNMHTTTTIQSNSSDVVGSVATQCDYHTRQERTTKHTILTCTMFLDNRILINAPTCACRYIKWLPDWLTEDLKISPCRLIFRCCFSRVVEQS